MKCMHLLFILLAVSISTPAAEASSVNQETFGDERRSVPGFEGLMHEVDSGLGENVFLLAQQSQETPSESEPAGTIYYWTDENGVRHFTNKGQPEDAENVGKKLEMARPARSQQEAQTETERTGMIYYWTDENGVRHFTNKGRPEGVDNVGKRQEAVSPEAPNNLAIEEPPAEEVTEDQGRQQAREERMARRIEAERQRLQAEIGKIDNLAIGVSFTQGMKDNRMRPFKEQLALLNEDPQRYFRMKRDGAFDN